MQQLHPTILNNLELIAAATRILPVIDAVITNEPLLQKVSAAAANDSDELSEAEAADRSDAFTEQIKTADEARDAAYVAARDYCKAFTHLPAGEKRSAGDLLNRIFIRHGVSLHRLGYSQQTGKMVDLFAELAGAPAQAALATVNGTEFVQAMTQAQAAFEALVQQRAATKADAAPPSLLTPSRRGLTQRLGFLMESMALWAELEPPAEVRAAIAQLDALNPEIMAPARARRTREDKSGTSAVPATPAPTPAPVA